MVTTREAYFRAMADALPPETLVVTSLGNASYLWAVIRDRPENFYVEDAMGLALPLALGLAVARPDRRVVVVEGDGGLLMHMGGLITVGAAAPENLTVLLIQNGVHAASGGQDLTNAELDFAALGLAAGLKDARNIEAVEVLRACARRSAEGSRPDTSRARHRARSRSGGSAGGVRSGGDQTALPGRHRGAPLRPDPVRRRAAGRAAAVARPGMIVERRDTWEEVRAAFRWRLPPRYNIAEHVCERHVASTRPALICPDPAGGDPREWSFLELSRLSNRLANALAAGGVGRGDRVAVLLGQGVETGLAHLAAYKLGAVALPLFTLFGAEALEHRLRDSGAKALITDAEGRDKTAALDLPELSLTVADDFWDLLERGSDRFETAATGPDDPALLMYTSGTTGPPKGALHGHRVLPGHLPGVALPHEFFPQPGDLFWTPADWAWAGGLLDVLLPAWAAGCRCWWSARASSTRRRPSRLSPAAACETPSCRRPRSR